MLKIVRITFALIALALAIYSLIIDNRTIMPYMLITLGFMAFAISLEELNKHHKISGTIGFLAGFGALFLALSDLLR
ncbi:DUF3953 domain-containing protein [Bacillus gaemokensis]|uniref:DUF3953 domain-containing protein n=1 Tax=Bacillus gaemokensis TaxID=574375 RepID=A0A073KQE2_9BACI|nr:DUF3953 domain-containing protein [Bacillus gaemokensis]KEK24608.1 hypothetical protein BAGA_26030 [Bacillus gaemokensis]KYG39493.1 hypothetical protein AZF08_05560 [Bacillus gaemokensis]